jgi:hypothetical protein
VTQVTIIFLLVGAVMMALCARYAIRQTVRRYGLRGSEAPAA